MEKCLEGRRALWGSMPMVGPMVILIHWIWSMEMPMRHVMGTWLMFMMMAMAMGIVIALVGIMAQGTLSFRRFWSLESFHTLFSSAYP